MRVLIANRPLANPTLNHGAVIKSRDGFCGYCVMGRVLLRLSGWGARFLHPSRNAFLPAALGRRRRKNRSRPKKAPSIEADQSPPDAEGRGRARTPVLAATKQKNAALSLDLSRPGVEISALHDPPILIRVIVDLPDVTFDLPGRPPEGLGRGLVQRLSLRRDSGPARRGSCSIPGGPGRRSSAPSLLAEFDDQPAAPRDRTS